MLCRFALGREAFIVCVDETTKTGAVAADDYDGLADPALDVLDVAAAHAAECVHNVDEVGADVAQHVDEAARLAEGHNHGGVLDKAQGLCVERVPEDVVGAACGQGGRIDGVLLGVRVNGLELFPRRACRCGDGRV